MRLLPSRPRLLPLTMTALTCLLAVKSAMLLQSHWSAPATAGSPAGGRVDTGVISDALAVVQSAQAAAADPNAQPNAPASAAPATGSTQTADAKATADAKSAAATRPPEPSSPPPISDSERALLLDLRQRRSELDARESAVAAREAVLSAAEKRLAGRVDELAALQSKLEALEAARKDRDEATWRGLVKTYEVMKPRDAAAIFNDLDMMVLLQVLDRMKESKAALILAAMLPERARQATAQLAEMRLKANSVAADRPVVRAGG